MALSGDGWQVIAANVVKDALNTAVIARVHISVTELTPGSMIREVEDEGKSKVEPMLAAHGWAKEYQCWIYPHDMKSVAAIDSAKGVRVRLHLVKLLQLITKSVIITLSGSDHRCQNTGAQQSTQKRERQAWFQGV